jgi:hypothetical protein
METDHSSLLAKRIGVIIHVPAVLLASSEKSNRSGCSECDGFAGFEDQLCKLIPKSGNNLSIRIWIRDQQVCSADDGDNSWVGYRDYAQTGKSTAKVRVLLPVVMLHEVMRHAIGGHPAAGKEALTPLIAPQTPLGCGWPA